jgi:hypothetical protein
MLLRDIVAQNRAVPLRDISLHIGLAKELQDQLALAGILDPTADGDFGPVSTWALGAFAGTAQVAAVTPQLAQELLDAGPLPLTPSDELTDRLLRGMDRLNFWISRQPGCVNILYVEGMGPDGVANANRPNQFNDSRFVLKVEQGGRLTIVGAWEATTEPGKQYTEHPESLLGAARISFGQSKAWSVGNHKNNPDHEALVQASPITVYRDRNKDYRREGDDPQTGNFGINQHHGFDYGRDDIRNASAGCLVGRLKTGHRKFMTIVKSDPRYGASRGYRYMTAIMDYASVPATDG